MAKLNLSLLTTDFTTHCNTSEFLVKVVALFLCKRYCTFDGILLSAFSAMESCFLSQKKNHNSKAVLLLQSVVAFLPVKWPHVRISFTGSNFRNNLEETNCKHTFKASLQERTVRYLSLGQSHQKVFFHVIKAQNYLVPRNKQRFRNALGTSFLLNGQFVA